MADEIKRPRVKKARQAFVRAQLDKNPDMTRAQAQATFATLAGSMKGRTNIVQMAEIDPATRKDVKKAIRLWAESQKKTTSTSSSDNETPADTNLRSSVNAPVATQRGYGTPRAPIPGYGALKPEIKIDKATFLSPGGVYTPSPMAKWFEDQNIPILGRIAPGARALSKEDYVGVAGQVGAAAFEKALLKGGAKLVVKGLRTKPMTALGRTLVSNSEIISGLTNLGRVATGAARGAARGAASRFRGAAASTARATEAPSQAGGFVKPNTPTRVPQPYTGEGVIVSGGPRTTGSPRGSVGGRGAGVGGLSRTTRGTVVQPSKTPVVRGKAPVVRGKFPVAKGTKAANTPVNPDVAELRARAAMLRQRAADQQRSIRWFGRRPPIK